MNAPSRRCSPAAPIRMRRPLPGPSIRSRFDPSTGDAELIVPFIKAGEQSIGDFAVGPEDGLLYVIDRFTV
ncbi:MAG TPA: hypothetical protein VFG22_14705 [Polyangiales bacterium]|nr:hypothetical protein [Polyangiales bacterium]